MIYDSKPHMTGLLSEIANTNSKVLFVLVVYPCWLKKMLSFIVMPSWKLSRSQEKNVYSTEYLNEKVSFSLPKSLSSERRSALTSTGSEPCFMKKLPWLSGNFARRVWFGYHCAYSQVSIPCILLLPEWKRAFSHLIPESKHDAIVVAFIRHSRMPCSQISETYISLFTNRLDRRSDLSSRLQDLWFDICTWVS